MDHTLNAIIESLSRFLQRPVEADTDLRELEGWSSLRHLEQILAVEQDLGVLYQIEDFPALNSPTAFREHVR